MLRNFIELGRLHRFASVAILIGVALGFAIATEIKNERSGSFYQDRLRYQKLVGAPVTSPNLMSFETKASSLILTWVHEAFECPVRNSCYCGKNFKIRRLMTPEVNRKFENLFRSIGLEENQTKVFVYNSVLSCGSPPAHNGKIITQFPIELYAPESELLIYKGSIEFTIEQLGSEIIVTDLNFVDNPNSDLNLFLKAAHEAKHGKVSKKSISLLFDEWNPTCSQTKHLKNCDEALRLSPTLALASFEKAKVHYNLGKIKDVIKDLDNVVKSYPNIVDWKIARGKLKLDINDAEGAIADLSEALESNPKLYRTRQIRSQGYNSLKQTENAMADLTYCSNECPQDPANLILKGECYQNSDEISKAVEQYTKKIELEKSTKIVFFRKFIESEQILNLFSEDSEGNALLKRAGAFYQMHEYEKAKADLKEALKEPLSRVDFLNAQIGLAFARKSTEQKWIVLADFDSSIKKFRNTPCGNLARGRVLLQFEEFVLAEKEFSSVIKSNPNIASLYMYRAFCKSKNNKEKEALLDFNKALSLNPTDTESLDGRGSAYFKLGNSKLALADFNEAIRLCPHTGTFRRRGNTHKQLGSNDKALADYQKSLELDATNALTHLDRGTLYAAIGNTKKAESDYKKALKLEPDLRFEHFELWFI